MSSGHDARGLARDLAEARLRAELDAEARLREIRDLAHGFSNAIVALTSLAETCLSDPAAEGRIKERLEIICGGAGRANSFVREMGAVCRKRTADIEEIELAPWLESQRGFYLALLPPGSRLDIKDDSDRARIAANPDCLRTAIANIVFEAGIALAKPRRAQMRSELSDAPGMSCRIVFAGTFNARKLSQLAELPCFTEGWQPDTADEPGIAAAKAWSDLVGARLRLSRAATGEAEWTLGLPSLCAE